MLVTDRAPEGARWAAFDLYPSAPRYADAGTGISSSSRIRCRWRSATTRSPTTCFWRPRRPSQKRSSETYLRSIG